MARWSAQARKRIPSCCGAFAAAGATSGWRRGRGSSCLHYPGPSAGASPPADPEPRAPFPRSGAPPPTHPGVRAAAFNTRGMAAWPDAALDEQPIDWAGAAAAALEPWSVSGGYMNYMQADEPLERVRAAFGDAAFGRLQALKRRYDPDNVLRR